MSTRAGGLGLSRAGRAAVVRSRGQYRRSRTRVPHPVISASRLRNSDSRITVRRMPPAFFSSSCYLWVAIAHPKGNKETFFRSRNAPHSGERRRCRLISKTVCSDSPKCATLQNLRGRSDFEEKKIYEVNLRPRSPKSGSVWQKGVIPGSYFSGGLQVPATHRWISGERSYWFFRQDTA